MGELVEVECGDLAVGLAKDDAVEPEFIVLRVGIPRPGGTLFGRDDGADDPGGDGVMAC